MVRAKAGDTDAFQALIHEEKEKLYKMAFVYMQNEHDALEVFQETVYKSFKSIATLKNNEYFSTWLTRILINTALDLLRKKKKVVSLSNEVLESMGTAWQFKSEEQLDLLNALDKIEFLG